MRTRFFDTENVEQVLKRCTGTSQGADQKRADVEESKNGHRSVLVVDDERLIADTLATILNNSGFRATVAYDGTSALDQLRSSAPDLLITDVSMPGMNGIELATKVRDLWPQCTVLLFSGHASSSELLREARDRGYQFELVSKPVHPRDLLEKLAA